MPFEHQKWPWIGPTALFCVSSWFNSEHITGRQNLPKCSQAWVGIPTGFIVMISAPLHHLLAGCSSSSSYWPSGIFVLRKSMIVEAPLTICPGFVKHGKSPVRVSTRWIVGTGRLSDLPKITGCWRRRRDSNLVHIGSEVGSSGHYATSSPFVSQD